MIPVPLGHRQLFDPVWRYFEWQIWNGPTCVRLHCISHPIPLESYWRFPVEILTADSHLIFPLGFPLYPVRVNQPREWCHSDSVAGGRGYVRLPLDMTSQECLWPWPLALQDNLLMVSCVFGWWWWWWWWCLLSTPIDIHTRCRLGYGSSLERMRQ